MSKYDGRYPEPPYDKGDDATVELAVLLTERDAEIERLRAALAHLAEDEALDVGIRNFANSTLARSSGAQRLPINWTADTTTGRT